MNSITYITPIYNTGEYNVRMTYKSLCKQTNPNWIWVIYNDNEGYDSAVDAIHSFNDERIIFIEHEPYDKKGTGPAKYIAYKKANECVPHNVSKVFCEIDSDDIISNDCTQSILDCYNKTAFEFVHAKTLILKDEITPIVTGYCDAEEYTHPLINYKDVSDCFHPYDTYECIAKDWVIMNLRGYDRDFYERIGGFDPNMTYGEDLEITIRVMKYANRIAYIPKQLYFYYSNGSGVSGKINCDDYIELAHQKDADILNEYKNSSMQIIEQTEDYILYKNVLI